MTKFLKSFMYAFNGIKYCILYERNFRFDIVVMTFVLIFKRFYELTDIENIIIIITFALVLSTEAMNTAVEAVADLASPKYHRLAKIAKDTAAGSVLIKAICAVFVGIYIFWDVQVFKEIALYFRNNIIFSVSILLLILISYIFVFKININNKDVDNDN